MDPELKKKQSLVKELRKVKAFEIQRLCKRVRVLKGKKGTELQIAKNERKANRLLQEIDFLKDVNLVELAEKMMNVDISEFENDDVEDNTVERRVLCKLANSKYIRIKLSEFKSFDGNERNTKKKAEMPAGRKSKKLKVHNDERKVNDTEKQIVDIGEESVEFVEKVVSLNSDQNMMENGKEREMEKVIPQRKGKTDKSNSVGRRKNWPRKKGFEDDNEGIVESLNFDHGIVESEEEFEKALEGREREEDLGGSVFVGLMSQSKEKQKKRKKEKENNNKKKIKSKNRMGQRERRKLWETMYGLKATHKKKERKEKLDARKNESRSSQMGKRKKMEGENKNTGRKINQSEEKLHPSWEASKRRKMQQNVEFQGQKITFNDED